MNNAIGTTFDDFLDDEGIRLEVETAAVKKIISFQMQHVLKEQHITKTQLAQKLETSRAAVDRLLDPKNESVTLLTLIKAAAVLNKKIRLELV